MVVLGVETSGALFCGDVLFSQGCGRFFEGTAEQMLRNADRIASLPNSVLIFCGHEYTLTNARFSAWLEPDCEAVQRRLEEVETLRGHATPVPTVPTAVGRERETNPFLRAREAATASAVRRRALDSLGGGLPGELEGGVEDWDWEDPVVVMLAMRRMRDAW